MSFIPSSAMPHAKPHEEHDPEHTPEHGHKPEHGHTPDGGQAPEPEQKTNQVEPSDSTSDHRQENGAGQPQQATSLESAAPEPPLAAPTPSDDRQGPEASKKPWIIALAVGGVVAVGAATAVLFRRESQPAKKIADQPAKAKRKGGKKSA